jgi:histidine triad (HIT) family protein
MAERCIFCEIAAGSLAAPKVFEGPDSLAFLDHRPLFAGHCLLIPRVHVETLTDLPPERVGPLFVRARLLCAAVEQALNADGTFLAVNNRVSQSVPHLHIHVVPRRRKDGLRGFFWPRGKYPDSEELESVRMAIRTALERLEGLTNA